MSNKESSLNGKQQRFGKQTHRRREHADAMPDRQLRRHRREQLHKIRERELMEV